MRPHPSRLAAVALSAAVACALAPAAAAATRTLTTKGAIASLAMQDSRVAVTARETLALCDRAMVWNPLAGGVVVVSDTTASVTCPSERPNGGIGAVALANGTVSWLTTFGGNTEQTSWLQKASTATPGKETTVARATSNPETATGDFLGSLVGRNSLTAFNSFSSATTVVPRLRRITQGGSATMLSGPRALAAGATDGSTVAVPNADGTITLVSSAGAILHVLTPSAAVRSVAINAGKVAVQEVGSIVETFSVASGGLVGTLTLQPGSAAGIDLYRGVLVYHTFRDVRALGVATGTDRSVANAPRAVVDAEIESPGIVYGYNAVVAGEFAGKAKRVPLATVLDAVS
jgi:hypothetical protein